MPDQVTLRERLHVALTDAIRAQDALRRDVLRLAQNAAYSIEKREHRELTEDEMLAVLTREVKTRRESVEAFRAGGREDLAAKEEAEIEVLREFLPEALTEEQLREMVAAAIAETGAASPRDLGKVMGRLAPQTRGRADGKLVSRLVNEALAGPGR